MRLPDHLTCLLRNLYADQEATVRTGHGIEEQRHYFANKGPSSQGYGFSSGYVWMWKLDYKESWAPKNWCFWIVALKKTLESLLDCKEIQPVHPRGDQSWVFIGRTDAEAEAPILWPPDAKSWLIGKDPDAEKDWGQEEKGMTEDEWLDVIIDSMDMALGELWDLLMDREAWRAAVHGASKSQTWLSDWTELNWCQCLGFPGGSVVKNPPAKAGDMHLNPGLIWSPGGENGNPLQYSCQNNPMDRGAWRVAGDSWVTVEKSQVQTKQIK